MAKYLPKAERMFQQKLQALLGPLEYGYNVGEGIEYDLAGDIEMPEGHMKIHEYHHPYGPFRTERIAELFEHYGHYLMLIEENDAEEADA